MVEYAENVSETYANYLDDESGIAKGTSATRIWFPRTHDEVIEVVRQSYKEKKPLTVSGGGTGISGGRAPLGGWILATDKMTEIRNADELWRDPETGQSYAIRFSSGSEHELVTVPAGMPLVSILRCCRARKLLYPPDPTERSSFIGGNVATNASGARSFKFGSTRSWVQSAQIVLSNGSTVFLDRSRDYSVSKNDITFKIDQQLYNVPIPSYKIPEVHKHVAGPVLTTKSHPLDIFIGTNGIFGIVTEVTLRLRPLPWKIVSMFAYCKSIQQTLDLIRVCQDHRKLSKEPIPMSVEYLDNYAIEIMQQKDARIEEASGIVLLEQDVYSEQEEEEVLEKWDTIFGNLKIENVDVALTHQENEHHKSLRHWVPEYIISSARGFGFPLVISDTSVPDAYFEEFMIYLMSIADRFRNEGKINSELSTVLLGHVGDNHPHLALVPTNDVQAKFSQELLLDIIQKTKELHGSIASEHGLGKKEFGGVAAILYQYGEEGVTEVRKMKSVLDPHYLLCRGNIIPFEVKQ